MTEMAMPQIVGNAFVEQYYHILYQSPELVFRFYTEESVLSREDANGVMTSVKSMKAINDKILSMDYKECKAEIKSIDAQASYQGGVMVLVTGCLAGKDNLKKKFTQSFFLAPQEKGYFVFNDLFRYVADDESLEAKPVVVNCVAESGIAALVTPDPEPIHVSDLPPIQLETSIVEKSFDNGEGVYNPSEDEEGSVVDEEVVTEPPAQVMQNEDHPAHSASEPASSIAPEDTPKKSYASIVGSGKDAKGKPVPSSHVMKKTPNAVYVPTNTVRVASTQQSAPAPAPEASSLVSNNVHEISDNHIEVEGYSIYIRSLPMHVLLEEVEEEFKKFGPIKPDGIQVRSNKQQGYCFGFVEFETWDSMRSAVEASSIIMGNHQVYIEEKKSRMGTGGGGGVGRGRYYSGSRGGPQNDNFRGRGSFNGARGYEKNNYGNQRGEYSGRGRGSSGGRGGGDSYQRVNQSGSGRGVRQGGTNQA